MIPRVGAWGESRDAKRTSVSAEGREAVPSRVPAPSSIHAHPGSNTTILWMMLPSISSTPACSPAATTVAAADAHRLHRSVCGLVVLPTLWWWDMISPTAASAAAAAAGVAVRPACPPPHPPYIASSSSSRFASPLFPLPLISVLV